MQTEFKKQASRKEAWFVLTGETAKAAQEYVDNKNELSDKRREELEEKLGAVDPVIVEHPAIGNNQPEDWLEYPKLYSAPSLIGVSNFTSEIFESGVQPVRDVFFLVVPVGKDLKTREEGSYFQPEGRELSGGELRQVRNIVLSPNQSRDTRTKPLFEKEPEIKEEYDARQNRANNDNHYSAYAPAEPIDLNNRGNAKDPHEFSSQREAYPVAAFKPWGN